MNWISEVVRPRIKTLFKRETPENLWVKCPDSGQMVFHKEVEGNHWVIPGSEHHLKMSAQARLKMMFDEGTWIDVPLPEVAADPLKFRDEKRYADRLKDARAKTGMPDAFKIGFGRVSGMPMTLAVQDFAFMAGSSAWRRERPSCAAPRRRWTSARPTFCSRPPAAHACRRASCRSCRCRARRWPCAG